MTQKLTSAQRRTYRTRNKLRRINKSSLPRLSIHRTGKQIYAQVIDDMQGKTIASASTLEAGLKEKLKTNGANMTAAAEVGRLVAARAKEAGIEQVQFDRGRFLYHGRVKALADGARENGLKF
ncbi:MAG: 50S ribosomal protein L18 [Rhodospirillales bacterium]|nr:50S ribosomal protein L18 [Rhodospirillales bacterium]